MIKDTLNRYLFDNANVRGQLVQLEKSYQEVLQAHRYPASIQVLLGELMAATSLLTATLKFEGDISIQLQGDGLVSLAVINGNNQQQLRGVARWQGDPDDNANLKTLLGNGQMVITLTPDKGERYQGIIALDKATISECLEQYFAQSEQLPTVIQLFANGQQAAGILLQRLPHDSSDSDDSSNSHQFEHLEQLTRTIKAEELFELEASKILHRLYHEEDIRLFDSVNVSFSCGCSEERSKQALRTIEKTELDSIIAEQGIINMDCEYCNHQYRFDSIDIEALYSNAARGC